MAGAEGLKRGLIGGEGGGLGRSTAGGEGTGRFPLLFWRDERPDAASNADAVASTINLGTAHAKDKFGC